ncbi:hypothetical protein [Microbacterium karelineae]|uniref:hypothetical protein n=1 Tax=Microbacterium karelineae TaxID=2654283 RepID=UPI0012EA4B85|nr:hypothetical protein [Microbacterium karelineae]
MTNVEPAARRRRARVWIGVASLPVVLIALGLVAKILTMYAFAHASVAAHVRGDAPAAIAAAEGLQPLNWFEPWKAPYDLGVGLARAEHLGEARAEFERALPLATGLDVCPVRINLALVLERMGDAARSDDPARASALYDEALALTLETPEECRSDEAREQSPDPSRDPAEALDSLVDRLREKQSDGPQEPTTDDGDEPTEAPDDGDLGDIEDLLRDGQEARDDRERGGEGGSGEPEVDRPW